MHEARDCDLIVCWKRFWEDCPLEVLELSKLMDKIMSEDEPPPRRHDGEKQGLPLINTDDADLREADEFV